MDDSDIIAVVGVAPSRQSRTPPAGAAIPAVASAAELCALTGVSDNRGRELASRGVFVSVGRNRYDTRASIRAYCVELAVQAKRGGVGTELEREKVRVQRETADKLAQQNALARNELIAATDVEKAWAGILRDVRAALLAVPSRVGSRVPTLTPHDIGEIGREIADALAELGSTSLQ